MAEATAPGDTGISANDPAIIAAQAAVAAAIAQLALDQVTADLDPTAKNLAAVTALQQRVATDEAILAALYKQAATGSAPPTTVIPPSPGGVGAGGGETLPGSSKNNPLAGLPTFIITGVAEGSAAANAAGAWGTFLDETDGLVDINNSLDAIAASALGAGSEIEIAAVGGGIVAAIADLPEIILAFMSLLIVYGVGKILVYVGRYFPNPSIFGWHPLNFIQAGIQDTGKGLVAAADIIIDPIVALFLTPVHLVTALFQRVTNAIASAHRKIGTLFNTTIPQARHDAVVTSENYTDQSVSALTVDLQNQISQLRTDTTNAIAVAKGEAILGAQAALTATEQQLLQRVANDETIMAAITTEIQTTLPDDIAKQVSDAQAAEQQQLTATANNLQANINGIANQIATANGQIATTIAEITSLQTQLDALGPETPDNAAEITALQTQIATATDDYNQLVVTVDDLNNQITGISSTLGQVTAAQQLTTSQINGITALGATGLVAVIATLATQINKIQTEIDTCLVDNCDQTKPNNIHNVLKDILAGITAAAEIAFIAGAIKDPEGTANVLAPTLDEIDDTATSTLNALLEL